MQVLLCYQTIQEFWVINGPCLSGVEEAKVHVFTSNHTTDMFSNHLGFLSSKLQN